MLIKILEHVGKVNTKTPHENIKEIYSSLIKLDELNMFMVIKFLTYLKFDREEYVYYYKKHDKVLSKNISKIMTTVIKDTGKGKWLTMKDLYLYLEYHENLFLVFPLQYDDTTFYFNETDTNFYDQRERIAINSENYFDTVFQPFMRAFFYVLASLGIVDLAGTEPFNDRFHSNKNKYLSLFDGLEAARLTPLGAYALGLTKKIPVLLNDTDPFEIHLDDQFLLIRTKGPDRVRDFIIQGLAEKSKPRNPP